MNMHKLLTSSFGLGFLPVAPGTWGSLAPAVIYMAAGILIGPRTAIASMAVLLILGCVVTVMCSPKVIALTGSKDPGQIVSDEVAGQALTLLLVQWLMPTAEFCIAAAAGFGLFRLFDIIKPWPCRRLENLPAGWGILADDLAAGIWAGGVWMAGRYIGQHIATGEQVVALTTGVAVFLGIVQGLTEFFPVSSEGHLVLFQHFLPGMNAESPQMLLLDLWFFTRLLCGLSEH
jgi:phosphatidylglycerophosphatase A